MQCICQANKLRNIHTFGTFRSEFFVEDLSQNLRENTDLDYLRLLLPRGGVIQVFALCSSDEFITFVNAYICVIHVHIPEY